MYFSHIVTDGPETGTLTPGEHVTFTYEALPQGEFGYRAALAIDIARRGIGNFTAGTSLRPIRRLPKLHDIPMTGGPVGLTRE
jgi:hypothetical protein